MVIAKLPMLQQVTRDDVRQVAQLKRIQEYATYTGGVGTTVTDEHAVNVNVGDGLTRRK